VAVVDGKAKVGYNFLHRGLTDEKFNEILEFPEWEKLDSRIGVIYIEVVQPIEKPFQEAGMVCVGIVRPPTVRQQKYYLSEKINNYMSNNKYVNG
jgi:hypothetical protein